VKNGLIVAVASEVSDHTARCVLKKLVRNGKSKDRPDFDVLYPLKPAEQEKYLGQVLDPATGLVFGTHRPLYRAQ
jgi:hypothetical protein